MNIADLKLGQVDGMGETIVSFYGLKPPQYAVYRTPRRITIQFADVASDASIMRRKIAPLNPLRGEINGLIDGWRTSRDARLQAKAERFDRRVADALICGLEDDLDGARTLLAAIKQDILDTRTSWARLEYLLASFVLAAICVALVLGFKRFAQPTADVLDLYRAAAAGTVGAFFSIALGIRKRTVLPDLQRSSNLVDAALRIVIGLIGGIVLVLLLVSGFVTFSLGTSKIATLGVDDYLKVLVIGFVAGFSERFVPDLLSKAGVVGTASDETARKAVEKGPGSVDVASTSKPQAAAVGQSVLDETADPDDELDHCVCDHPLSPLDATPDDALPAAAGGVARS